MNSGGGGGCARRCLRALLGGKDLRGSLGGRAHQDGANGGARALVAALDPERREGEKKESERGQKEGGRRVESVSILEARCVLCAESASCASDTQTLRKRK